jgi:septal ring factor EnvC (AmiA/AmiB activator)
VRLPIDVVKPDHPYNALFPGDDSEHLFVTTVDGAKKHALESDTSRTQLCAAMTEVLAASYAKDPEPLFKDIHVYGDKLDALDNEAKGLQAERAKLMEARVPDKKKLGKLDGDIARVQKQIDDQKAAIEKASKIPLKAPPKPAKTG